MKFYNILVFLLLFVLVSCADSVLSGNNEKERALFEKIKVGMTRSEVEAILGMPDRSDIDSNSNNTLYYYYYTKNKGILRSTLPTVMFDSTGVVKFSTYGEGG